MYYVLAEDGIPVVVGNIFNIWRYFPTQGLSIQRHEITHFFVHSRSRNYILMIDDEDVPFAILCGFDLYKANQCYNTLDREYANFLFDNILEDLT